MKDKSRFLSTRGNINEPLEKEAPMTGNHKETERKKSIENTEKRNNVVYVSLKGKEKTYFRRPTA